MKKILLFLGLLSSPLLADQVQIVSPLPLPVSTSIQLSTTPFVSLSSATINFSSTGNNTVIAGVTSQTIRIFRLILVVSAATNLTFQDGTNALSGAMNLTSNGSIVLDLSNFAWYVTSAGNAFTINQSGTAQVSGSIWYSQS